MGKSSISEKKCLYSGENLYLTGDVCWDRPDILVGKCPITNIVQLVEFSHVDESFYRQKRYSVQTIKNEIDKQSNWNDKRIVNLKRYIPDIQKKYILDYGAGTGSFLARASQEFSNVYGFDVNCEASRINRSFGLNYSWREEDLPREINVIVLFHIIEHIQKPWQFLDDLTRRFSACEYVVVEVPNTQEALLSLYQSPAYRANHFNSTHLYYFTNETLALMLKRAGFEILVSTQLQRYPLSNHLVWLAQGKRDGQSILPEFNDSALNDRYGEILVQNRIADSCFIVAKVLKNK